MCIRDRPNGTAVMEMAEASGIAGLTDVYKRQLPVEHPGIVGKRPVKQRYILVSGPFLRSIDCGSSLLAA